jgi:hypothetical protein
LVRPEGVLGTNAPTIKVGGSKGLDDL